MNGAPFRILWLSQSLANLGDSFYIVAVVTLIYERTGSAAAAGAFPLARVIGQGLSGILAPLLLDRWRLAALLWVFEIGQTACMLLLCAAVWGMPAHGGIAFILGTVFCVSVQHGWAISVRNALVPQLVEPARMLNANSLLAASDQAILMTGWTTGGMLVARYGSAQVLLGVAALLFISTLALSLIRRFGLKQAPLAEVRQDYWQSLKEGWTAIFRHPFVRQITLMEIVAGLGGSVWAGSIILVFVKEVLRENESWWGYINAGSLGGAIAGGLAVYAVADRIKNSFQTSMIVSSLLIGLLLLLFAYSNNGWLCLLYAFLAGPAYQLRGIILKTAYQTCIPPALLPKSFSAFGTLAYMTYGISVVLLSGLADILGIQAVFAVTAVLYGLSAAIPLIKPKRHSSSGTLNLDG